MMAALTVVSSPITLYQIEEQLQALFDSAELVAPEQETEFMAELSKAIEKAVDKRQRVAEFIAHCQSQIVLAQVALQQRLKSGDKCHVQCATFAQAEGLGRLEQACR